MKLTTRGKVLAIAFWISTALILGFVTAPFNWYSPLPDCEWEDSYNCHWNASTQGNGQGHSFVNLGGSIIYLD
jgi:hypothetical protein